MKVTANCTYSQGKKRLVKRIYFNQKLNSTIRGHTQPDYTFDELMDWLIKQVSFDCLFLNWINSGRNKWKAPSCDRKNDYLPYTLENIQLMTWQENFNKGHLDRKSGINNKYNKAVIKMKKTGEVIAEYFSLNHAARSNNICPSSICKCCGGKNNRKTAGGFSWKYAD